MEDVRARRLPLIARVEQEVRARLQKEIILWDRRAQDLLAQEAAGKKTRLPAQVAQEWADRLADRMKQRLADLERERMISPRPPAVKGGALVIPIGLLRELGGASNAAPEPTPLGGADRDRVERLAMEAVMAAERRVGREPRDVSAQRGIGHDIESRDPATGALYFIEVKGRAAGADQVTLTRTEILCARNEPERFRLALVLVADGRAAEPVYVQGYDFGQPGFAQTSATFPVAGACKGRAVNQARSRTMKQFEGQPVVLDEEFRQEVAEIGARYTSRLREADALMARMTHEDFVHRLTRRTLPKREEEQDQPDYEVYEGLARAEYDYSMKAAGARMYMRKLMGSTT
jgi:hypothetical protein